MYVEKETAPDGDAVTDKAAEITCAWLARNGLELVETAVADPEGERSCGMKIRSVPGKLVCMNNAFPAWDWAGLDIRTPGEAWLAVANWLFGLRFSGPSWVQETDQSRPLPGWVVVKTKRRPVPKLAFSSLEEFVLKAAVLPDFQEVSGKPAPKRKESLC